MIKRETLEPLEKEDIINIFVEFNSRIDKKMQLLRYASLVRELKLPEQLKWQE